MNRFLFHRRDTSWQQISTAKGHRLSLKGNAYIENQPASPAAVATALEAAQSPDTLTSLLQRMNGFYTWVVETTDGVRAAVDHIRSFPLFYAINNGDLFLSDDAEWIRQQVGDEEMDPVAREEFLLAGYVTGSDTLYPQVKQLQAGEYLQAINGSDGVHVSKGRYYRFWHTEPEIYDETHLRAKLKIVTINAMQRLIEQANGRQIVMPLSGGYDSRLIASMLKELGYTNVTCFTYGVPGNKEAEYSRKVAHALGFKWLFVEYSTALWRNAWCSFEAHEYRKMAANHTSLPHVQDWLAIKRLINEKLIESDAVVVPGHSGDFVAGSHIPDFVFLKDTHTQDSLLEILVRNHLSNCPKKGMTLESTEALNSRLLDRIAADFDGSAPAFANLYEMWDWQERQAKYIVNAVRVYDQFHLQWWLPLWDAEYVKFWQHVPLRLRKGRLWYKEWVSEVYSQLSVGSEGAKPLNNASDRSLFMKILMTGVRPLPESIKLSLKRMRAKHQRNNHFLALWGLVPKTLQSMYLSENFNIIGVFSDLYVTKRWGDME